MKHNHSRHDPNSTERLKRIRKGDGVRVVLVLALVFTVISSVLADRAARLMREWQPPLHARSQAPLIQTEPAASYPFAAAESFGATAPATESLARLPIERERH